MVEWNIDFKKYLIDKFLNLKIFKSHIESFFFLHSDVGEVNTGKNPVFDSGLR